MFDAQEGRETVLDLRLSMNVFDYFNGVRESAALMQEALAAKTEAHSEIAELQFLHSQVHEAEESIKKANTYLKLTLNEYSRGVKNSSDVLGTTEKVCPYLFNKTTFGFGGINFTNFSVVVFVVNIADHFFD